MFKLDSETLARVDQIRTKKGLLSRAQALDQVITSAWRESRNASALPADGGREEELMNRFDAVAQITLCPGDVLICQLVETFWTREKENGNGNDENGVL